MMMMTDVAVIVMKIMVRVEKGHEYSEGNTVTYANDGERWCM